MLANQVLPVVQKFAHSLMLWMRTCLIVSSMGSSSAGVVLIVVRKDYISPGRAKGDFGKFETRSQLSSSGSARLLVTVQSKIR